MMIPKTLLCAALLSVPAAASDELVDWDARAAEHLLNRAGFGARPAEVEAAVEAGLEATVDRLVYRRAPVEIPFFAERFSIRDGVLDDHKEAARARGMSKIEFHDENAMLLRELRVSEGQQGQRFRAWWIERMVSGADPLGEHMTLFWHGWFTSSIKGVQSSYEMIRQNQLLRAGALGSFADLVHAIARDPAMLEYLDNDKNRKGTPNENFARELMELFTLGEGNYTEADVKEVARAFTGWTDDRGEFRVVRGWHDSGEKTVLGRTGPFDGDDVIEILLEQEVCARRLADELIDYFEGQRPDPARLAEYTAFLRERDYDIAAFLERLFLDPDFYRDEVVGTRIAGPVEYAVGVARRLAVDPPGRALVEAAAGLGQELFAPPSVRGWERGTAWITTSSLMQRANLGGILLGVIADRFTGLDMDRMGMGSPAMDDGGEASRERAPRSARPGGGGPSGRPGGGRMSGRPGAGRPGAGRPGAGRGEARGAMDESMMGSDTMMAGGGEEDDGEDRVTRVLQRADWVPHLNFLARLRSAGLRSDAQIADALLEELLAVEPTAEARAEALAFVRAERERLELDDGELLEPLYAEHTLRRLAHLVLSLPEASLN